MYGVRALPQSVTLGRRNFRIVCCNCEEMNWFTVFVLNGGAEEKKSVETCRLWNKVK